VSISFEGLHNWFGFVYLQPNNKQIQTSWKTKKDTYLGKAMIQTMVATILFFCAVSHEQMVWTIVLGTAGFIWASFAHHNFNQYERRG
jgi:hypothetical protein